MILDHRLALAVIGIALSAPVIAAQDLSAYRSVHVGMSLAAVSAEAGADTSDATVIQRRPAVIQELAWRLRYAGADTRLDADPVQDIVFTFYNDKLFRVVATYDRAKIEGLTDKDLIDGMAAQYGAATIPPATITASRLSQAYRDNTEQVMARWEDADYSVNLVRSSYRSSVSLVMFSKQLDNLARVAITEAARLDTLEAPAREAARQQQKDTDARAAQEKARLANKPTFRP